MEAAYTPERLRFYTFKNSYLYAYPDVILSQALSPAVLRAPGWANSSLELMQSLPGNLVSSVSIDVNPGCNEN